MDEQDCVVYVGERFTIEWYYNEKGYSEAFEYFLHTSNVQKRKFFILVKRMAEFGKISDITKFRNEGNDIFAFKPQPDRYLAFFIKGKKIIITNGFIKKTEKLSKNEKDKAIKHRTDYLNRFKEEE